MNAPSRPRLRRLAPLAASVALHAVLVGLLLQLAPPRRRPAPAPRPLAVELRVVPRAAPPAEGKAPSAGPRRTSRPAGPTPVPRGAPLASMPSDGPAPGTVDWLRERGLEPGPGLPVPTLPPSGRWTGPAAPPAAPPPAAVDPKAAVDRMLADVQAVEKARTPHVYWSGLRERLEAGFAPGWEILPPAPGGALGTAGRAAGEVVRGWLADAERYGRTGALASGSAGPATRGVPPTGARPVLEPERPPVDGAFHLELETLVRLIQSEGGRVERVELVQGSGNPVHDRLALAQARALGDEASARLGPPPAQGRETLWAFRTSFDRVPPLPIVGCGFDAYFRPTECFYPLKTSSRSRVELREIR